MDEVGLQRWPDFFMAVSSVQVRRVTVVLCCKADWVWRQEYVSRGFTEEVVWPEQEKEHRPIEKFQWHLRCWGQAIGEVALGY